MNLVESVQTVLSKYAVFDGRARRSEYWWWFLALVILDVVFQVLRAIASPFLILEAIVSLGLLVPGIAVGIRRLHDTDRSGWWLLIGIIPIVGWIIVIVFTAQDGSPGDNQYGPSPKAVASY